MFDSYSVLILQFSEYHIFLHRELCKSRRILLKTLTLTKTEAVLVSFAEFQQKTSE